MNADPTSEQAPNSLEKALLAAHACKDHSALIQLYEDAANQTNDETERGFFLTHAYVFALETGSKEATRLRTRLAEMGRI